MRKNSLRLPRWIIKSLQHGKENEDLSSIVVGALALYSVCAIAYFACAPFGRGHLALEVVAALGILAFILLFGFWLIAQVALLDSLRKEALISFENLKKEKEISKKEKEISDVKERLKKLCVPVPEAA